MSTHNEPNTGTIIFSFMDDAVWATWPGQDAAVKLGPYDSVTYMMRDFLAQFDLAERLVPRRANG